MPVRVTVDRRGVAPLGDGRAAKAIARALRKAASTSLRDMRSEARKRVRARKRLKAKVVRKALNLRRPPRPSRGDMGMEWGVDVSGKAVRASAYPHRQTRRGVSVAVNKGKRSLLRSAFIRTLSSGHRGVFLRRGPRRFPIFEPLASRPVDALLHEGEADGVAERGHRSFEATFERVLPMELDRLG